jgi:hypothetical protein
MAEKDLLQLWLAVEESDLPLGLGVQTTSGQLVLLLCAFDTGCLLSL